MSGDVIGHGLHEAEAGEESEKAAPRRSSCDDPPIDGPESTRDEQSRDRRSTGPHNVGGASSCYLWEESGGPD